MIEDIFFLHFLVFRLSLVIGGFFGPILAIFTGTIFCAILARCEAFTEFFEAALCDRKTTKANYERWVKRVN